MDKNTTPIASSETMWFSFALVLFSSIAGVVDSVEFSNLVGDNYGWIGTVLGLIVAYLRFKTTTPISTHKNRLDMLDEHEEESI